MPGLQPPCDNVEQRRQHISRCFCVYSGTQLEGSYSNAPRTPPASFSYQVIHHGLWIVSANQHPPKPRSAQSRLCSAITSTPTHDRDSFAHRSFPSHPVSFRRNIHFTCIISKPHPSWSCIEAIEHSVSRRNSFLRDGRQTRHAPSSQESVTQH